MRQKPLKIKHLKKIVFPNKRKAPVSLFIKVLIFFSVVGWTATKAQSPHEPSQKAKIYFNQAVKFIKAGSYNEALSALTNSINYDPSQASAYLERAKIKMQYNQLVPARADLEKVLASNPINAEALYLTGYMDLLNKQYDNALLRLSNAISNGYNEASVFYYRGVTKFMKNDLNGALTDLTMAIDKDNTLAYAYHDRGLCAVSLKRCQKRTSRFSEGHYFITKVCTGSS